MLLNTMKDVAASLGDLIINSKKAHGKDVDHPAMFDMKSKAKVIHIEILKIFHETPIYRMLCQVSPI